MGNKIKITTNILLIVFFILSFVSGEFAKITRSYFRLHEILAIIFSILAMIHIIIYCKILKLDIKSEK